MNEVNKILGIREKPPEIGFKPLRQSVEQTEDYAVKQSIHTKELYVNPDNGIHRGIMPIGSVIAWLKSYTNTPALPEGWKECDGSAITEGVYAGQDIPNLNGGVRFLRGFGTSGTTGGSATHTHSYSHTHTYNHSHTYNHDHTFSGDTGQPNDNITVAAGTDYVVSTERHTHPFSGTTSTSSGNTSTSSGNTAGQSTTTTGSGSSLPPYYNVVWIMRIL